MLFNFFFCELLVLIIWNNLHVPKILEANFVEFSLALFFSTSCSRKVFNEYITSPLVQRAIFFNEEDFTLTIMINFDIFNKDSKSKLPIPLFNKIIFTSNDSIFALISSILYEPFNALLFRLNGSLILCSFKSRSNINISGNSYFSLIFLEHTFYVIVNHQLLLLNNFGL